MRIRYLPVSILSAATIFVVLVLRLGSPLPHNSAAPTTSPPVQDMQLEQGEAQKEVGALIPKTTEPVPARETPLEEGPALLESYCSQCHTTQRLAQIEKSRAEWEKTLAQMETIGVRLDESEKVVLLDYLAVAKR